MLQTDGPGAQPVRKPARLTRGADVTEEPHPARWHSTNLVGVPGPVVLEPLVGVCVASGATVFAGRWKSEVFVGAGVFVGF